MIDGGFACGVGALSAGISGIEQRAGKEQHTARDGIHPEGHVFIRTRIPHAKDKIKDGQIHRPRMGVYSSRQQAPQRKHQRAQLYNQHDRYLMIRGFFDPHVPDIDADDKAKVTG